MLKLISLRRARGCSDACWRPFGWNPQDRAGAGSVHWPDAANWEETSVLRFSSEGDCRGRILLFGSTNNNQMVMFSP